MTDVLNNLRNLGREIAPLAEKIRELAGDDDLAFIDTLDGETDAIRAASAAVRMVAAMEALEGASKALAQRYGSRAQDFADRSQRARDALAHFMAEIGEKRLTLPEGTITLAAGQASLQGDPDVSTLPDDYCRVTKAPDRALIKKALQDGYEVPGYSLSNAKPRLQIRTR